MTDGDIHLFEVFYDHEAEKYYIFAPEGCVLVNGKAATIKDVDSTGNVELSISYDSLPDYLWAHVSAASGGSGFEVEFDDKETKAGAKWDFRVARFGEEDNDGNQYDIATSVVSLGDDSEAAFSVKENGSSWKVRYFNDGSFTYAGFTPETVTPTPVDGWINLNTQARSVSIYGHATYAMDKDGDVTGCSALLINTSSGATGASSQSSSSSGTTTATFTFHIADIVDGVVSQDALGAIHAGGNGGNIDVDVDEISVDYQAAAPVSEGSGESSADESKVLEIKGWSSAASVSGTTLAAALGLPQQSQSGSESEGEGGSASGSASGSSRQVVVRNGVGGSLEYVDVGEVDMASLVDDIADEVKGEIGNGKLTIGQTETTEYGTIVTKLGEFTANQGTDTIIALPAAPAAPNDGVLSITVGSNSPVTFTANQATNTSVTIPEGVALTDTVPSDAVLSTGTALAGSSTEAARADHVHKLPSTVKIKQSPVADPTASGSATAFIDSISQNENGEITVTKKTVEVPSAQVQSDWNETDSTSKAFIKNKPTLAAVATSGSYNDLTNKPTIPAAQVNANWTATSGVAQILNKPTIPAIPTSGSLTCVTDIRFDTSSHQLQKKTRTISFTATGFTLGSESRWTMITGGQATSHQGEHN